MKFIDLFAGAGGLSEGFIRAGFQPVAHVEVDRAACFTLRTRVAYHYLKSSRKYKTYISYLRGEITRQQLYNKIPPELLASVINLPIGSKFNKLIHQQISKRISGKVDLIIGGPPCQAYSLVGRARSANGMDGDPRNLLYKEYARYIAIYKPKMFVFENVIGLLSAKNGQYLERMQKLFKKKGYDIQLFKVNAANFNVLQKRKRILIIGWLNSLRPSLPDLEGLMPSGEYRVKQLFEDLPPIAAGEGVDKFSVYRKKATSYLKDMSIRNGINILTQHISRPQTTQDKVIYRIAVEKWNKESERLDYNDLPEELKTHKNRHSFFDRFKVVADDLNYSHTVVAHIAKDGHYYIHPDIKQNRSLTVREAARLQSFPDDYYFEGVKEGANRTAAFRQIGNAVPPLMAQKIAEAIKSILQ